MVDMGQGCGTATITRANPPTGVTWYWQESPTGELTGAAWDEEPDDETGDDDRPDVNQFLFQPFVNYNLDGGWYLTSTPIMTANWDQEDDGWTVLASDGMPSAHFEHTIAVRNGTAEVLTR